MHCRPAHGAPRRIPYLMMPVLALLEPFAMSMWHRNIVDWLPSEARSVSCEKDTYFGGLYQKVVITV